MSRTRIIILQVKELIYTAIFVGLGILLLVLLFFMFWPGKEKDTASRATSTVSSNLADSESAAVYKPGVYTSELSLGSTSVNLQVTLDADQVKSVELVNLEESISTMYPLIEPAVEEISSQLAQNISLEEVVLSDDSQYTQQMILDTISSILEEASKTE